MNKKQLHILIIFMGISLLGIIAVQYVWIRNAIQIETDQFDHKVNAAMNSVIEKLEIQEAVLHITQNLDFDDTFLEYDIYTNDSHISRASKDIKAIKPIEVICQSLLLDTTSDVGGMMFITGDSLLQTTSTVSADITIPSMVIKNSINLDSKDSIRICLAESNKTYKVVVKRIKNAIDQMVLEYTSDDDPIAKRLDMSSLDSLINSELKIQGIDLPNEYGVLLSNSDSLLPYHSSGFNKKYINTKYRLNLFPDDIYAKSAFLLVHFPGKQMHIVNSISLMLLGSIILTIIIILTFARTIFIILRQKKLSEIKSDFINNMSHEFKTPIATISLAADSISNPKVLSAKDKILYYTGIIKEENKRMNKQVENILQMSLLEKHNLELNINNYDIHSLIRTSIRNMSLQLEKNGGHIETRLEAEQHFFRVDDIHFLNIINNLLDNAIKYSQSTPEIIIRTKNENESLIISVEDKGIGMNKDVQKKVFEKFYRVTRGNIHNTKGFGLGLSYVKAVLLMFGGDIDLQSKAGEGSVFTISLPARKS